MNSNTYLRLFFLLLFISVLMLTPFLVQETQAYYQIIPDSSNSNKSQELIIDNVEEYIRTQNMDALAGFIESAEIDNLHQFIQKLSIEEIIELLPKLSPETASAILSDCSEENAVIILEKLTSDVSSEIMDILVGDKTFSHFAIDVVLKMNSSARSLLMVKLPVIRSATIIGTVGAGQRVKLLEELPVSMAIEVLNCFTPEYALKYLVETNAKLTAYFVNQANIEFAYTILDTVPKDRLSAILHDVSLDRVVSYLWNITESERNAILSRMGNDELNLKFVKAGDIIQFGSYPYEKKGGWASIDWIVLNTDHGNIFMVSQKALDCQPFNKNKTSVQWESSSLRKWLNSTFLETAFSQKTQKDALVGEKTSMQMPDDLVFLLSVKEIEEYLSPLKKTSAEPTPYASKQGASTGFLSSNTKWWLRDPGKSMKASAVHPNGSIDRDGEDVDQTNRGVRPAIVVKYTSFSKFTSDTTRILDYSDRLGTYKYVVNAIEQDSYQSAVRNMDSVSGFMDIDELLIQYQTEKYQNAVAIGNSGDYDSAIKILNEMKDYADAEIMARYFTNQQTYDLALDAIVSDDYATASSLLQLIESFKDSRYQLENYRKERMSLAASYAENEDFSSAIAITEAMDDYPSAVEASAVYTNWKNYRLAETAIRKDDYITANEILKSLGDFEDSRQKLTEYREARIEKAEQACEQKHYQESYDILKPMEKDANADKVLAKVQRYEKYDQAMKAISNDDYRTAEQLLTELEGFLDSVTQLKNYKMDRVERAKMTALNKDYDSAYEILEPMSGFSPADEALTEIQNADRYDQAMTAIKNDDYENAVLILLELSSYKDSLLKLSEYRSDRIARARQAAEIKHYDYAYELLLPMEGIEKADIALREIRIMEQYDQGIKAILTNNYVLAVEKLEGLSGYLDSSERLKSFRSDRVTEAKKLASEKNYRASYELLTPMSDYPDAVNALADIQKADQYDQGLDAIEKDDYEKAVTLLSGLPGYKDSNYQLQTYRTARVNIAREKAKEKDYEGAYEILNPMVGYAEADRALTDIQKVDMYDQLLEAIDSDEYVTACELMTNLKGYKDASSRMLTYQNARIKRARELDQNGNRDESYQVLEVMTDSTDAVRLYTQMKNEDQYLLGMAAIELDNYEYAAKILTEIASYKDSTYQLNTYRNSRVKRARDAASEKRYQDSYAILEIMEGYAEADRALKDIQNADKYDQAMVYIENDDFEKASAILTELSAYKDSTYQLNTYRTGRIKRARDAAAEKRYQDAYVILAVMTGNAEVDRALKDIQNADKYDQAMVLIENDNYQEASSLLTEISSYKDSRAQQINYQNARIKKAKAFADESNFQDAYEILEPMTDSVEAVRVLGDIHKQEMYAIAMAAIEADDYQAASKNLTELGYYKDSQNQLQTYRTSRINTAKNLASEGNYNDAYLLLSAMDDYKYVDQVRETLQKDEKYDQAMRLIENEEYVAAEPILTSLGAHKNSNSQLYNMRIQCRTLAVDKIKAGDYSFAEKNIEVLDKSNLMTLLNSLSAQESKTLLLNLDKTKKLVPIFENLDVTSKLRILTLLDRENASAFLSGLPKEDVSALFRSAAYQTVVDYLSLMDNHAVINFLSTLDKANANYYLNGMNISKVSAIFKTMSVDSRVEYFNSMTNSMAAKILKEWTEEQRIEIFQRMDYTRTKDIYAILNLPKIISANETVYYLKEKDNKDLKYTLTGQSIDKDLIVFYKTNETVVTNSTPIFSSGSIKVPVKSMNPGSVYVHFETKYGRILSDQVVISVLRNTPTPMPIKYSIPNDNSNTYDNNDGNNYWVSPPSYSNSGNSGAVSSGDGGYSGSMVWIYETGSRYHSHHGCSGGNDWQVSIDEARNRGLTPCKKCY